MQDIFESFNPNAVRFALLLVREGMNQEEFIQMPLHTQIDCAETAQLDAKSLADAIRNIGDYFSRELELLEAYNDARKAALTPSQHTNNVVRFESIRGDLV